MIWDGFFICNLCSGLVPGRSSFHLRRNSQLRCPQPGIAVLRSWSSRQFIQPSVSAPMAVVFVGLCPQVYGWFCQGHRSGTRSPLLPVFALVHEAFPKKPGKGISMVTGERVFFLSVGQD